MNREGEDEWLLPTCRLHEWRSAVHVPVRRWCWATAGCCRPRSPGAGCCALQSASPRQPGWGRMEQHLTVSASRGITEPTVDLLIMRIENQRLDSKPPTDLLFIQQRTPVELLFRLQIWFWVIQFPECGAVLCPTIMQISHTE